MSYFREDSENRYLLMADFWKADEPLRFYMGSDADLVMSLYSDRVEINTNLTVYGDIGLTGTITFSGALIGLDELSITSVGANPTVNVTSVYGTQLRLIHNGSNYVNFNVNSLGDLFVIPTVGTAGAAINIKRVTNFGFGTNLSNDISQILTEFSDSIRGLSKIRVIGDDEPAKFIGIRANGSYTGPTQTLAGQAVAVFEGVGVDNVVGKTTVGFAQFVAVDNQTTTDWNGSLEIYLGTNNAGTTTKRVTLTNTSLDINVPYFYIGPSSALSTFGGLIRYRDDTAAEKWIVGLLGVAANKNYDIYDAVAGASRLTIDGTTGAVSIYGQLNALGNLYVTKTNAEVDIFLNHLGTNAFLTYFYNIGTASGFYDGTNARAIWIYYPAGAGSIEFPRIVSFTQPVTYSNKVNFADGSAADPSIGFASDANTGIYRIGADNIGIATGGGLRLDIATSQITVKTFTLFEANLRTTGLSFDISSISYAVSFGANDSAGAGFRLLRIANS